MSNRVGLRIGRVLALVLFGWVLFGYWYYPDHWTTMVAITTVGAGRSLMILVKLCLDVE